MDKYVLSIMLEEVLSCANRFLTRFSRDRYTLWSSQERTVHNACGGLDWQLHWGLPPAGRQCRREGGRRE